MKKLLFILIPALILFSCSDDDKLESESSDILGEWQLVESYIDPGDGSGEYTPVDADITINFATNGQVTSNKTFCSMGNYESGNFSSTYIASENRIEVEEDCSGFSNYSLSYELGLDGKLYIYHPCIEGCGEKYVRP